MKNILIVLIFILLLGCNNRRNIETNVSVNITENQINVSTELLEEITEKIVAIDNSENAAPNFCSFRNGNGTIIETKIIDNTIWVIRKHEQRIRIGDRIRNERLIVHDNPKLENSIELFRLRAGDYINTLEIIREENILNNLLNIWLKISTDNGEIGWINITRHRYALGYELGGNDPYDNDRWSIIETITANEREWTVRKQESYLSIWSTLDVRDKPGLYGSTILFQLVPILPQDNDGWIYFVEGFAITEETERINNRTDHWVKITDRQGRTGWIFGGWGDIERGGPKYLTPEYIILIRLNAF